jgi:hypothetical protein
MQLGVFTSLPTDDEETSIRAHCVRLQEEMYEFGHEQPKRFDGTVKALINAYQTDPDSNYQTMRYKTRLHTDSILKRVATAFGAQKLADIGARELKHWYEHFRWPEGKNGRELIPTAHAAMTAARMMLSFGSTFEIEKAAKRPTNECARVRQVLRGMRFELAEPRKQSLTLRQCEDVVAAAHAAGLHSIALAQTLQWDLRSRQRDIIGEWVPTAEPGVSDIHHRGRKWLRGIRWEEISSDMILEHITSKTGKLMKRDLKLYPLTMAELARIPAEKRTGPVVVSERTKRPWKQNNFRGRWRELADTVGIPKDVFNMDARAGGITETIMATGGNLEAARKEADHSKLEQTAKYSRQHDESNRETAVIVGDFRSKNRA